MLSTLIILLLLLVLTIPQDKADMDKAFMAGLSSYTQQRSKEIPARLVRIDKNLYASDEGFYETESVRNRSYFRKSSSVYQPVCDAALPEESVRTLLTGFTGTTEYMVHLTQHCYNHTIVEVDVPLAQLIGYCLDDGFSPFVGVESMGREQILATLFLVDSQRGLCHTFRFCIDMDLLDKGSGVFQASGYTYTPIHNLKP